MFISSICQKISEGTICFCLIHPLALKKFGYIFGFFFGKKENMSVSEKENLSVIVRKIIGLLASKIFC